MSSTKISVQLWRYYSIDTHCFLSTVGVWKSVFYTIHETTIAQIFKCWTSGLIFCNLPHKYYWPHLASIYSSSKHTVAGLDYVDTWEWSWMMQSILRVTGTYMVIKILSMHIPFSLNTALSVPPPPLPPFYAFKFSFFLRLLPCPAAVRRPDMHAYHWSKVNEFSKPCCDWPQGRDRRTYGPPRPGPHPSSRELRTEWN